MREKIEDLLGDDWKPRLLVRGCTILQWNDEWFNEIEDRWEKVTGDQIGQWDDDVFPPHVYIRGIWIRFSDAVHFSRFEGIYGRPKPLPQEHYYEI